MFLSSKSCPQDDVCSWLRNNLASLPQKNRTPLSKLRIAILRAVHSRAWPAAGPSLCHPGISFEKQFSPRHPPLQNSPDYIHREIEIRLQENSRTSLCPVVLQKLLP